MVNTKYEDKDYLFAMNGQTGEFVGNMPINIKKAIVFGIGIFVLVGLLITLISYFAYLGGSALWKLKVLQLAILKILQKQN